MSRRSTPSKQCSSGVKEDKFAVPVPPSHGGEGFPYAPTDWPNPGDTWGWKVGRRVNNSGYYTDRFLNLPRSLHKPNIPKQFASRLAIERYIGSEFPDADIDAFFASFIWKVPSTLWYSAEAVPLREIKEEDKEDGKEEGKAAGKEEGKEENPSPMKKKRKHTAATPLAQRRTRQSLRQSVPLNTKDTCEGAAPNGPSKVMKSTNDFNDDQPDNDSFAGSDSPSECIPEDFNSYLNSLVNDLAQPLSEVRPATTDDELAETQTLKEKKDKVSSLREEYNKVKEKVTQLQTELSSSILAVREIDNQVADLQARRGELMRKIETQENLKAKLTIDQQKMANAIQRIMHEPEVHPLNSKKPE